MDTHPDVENAILLLGHKLDLEGNIQQGTKIRADLAAQLYHEGVAPVIIAAGWYWPKDERLRQFREAEAMKRYLGEVHKLDNNVLCEPYSTRIPENLLFTKVMFPNLKNITIVVGRLFEARTKYTAEMTFGDSANITIAPAEDGLGDVEYEKRLIANVQCILKNVEPGDTEVLFMREPYEDGSLRSWWPDLNEAHKRNCLRHT